VARRTILKAQDRRQLFDIPADEDSLIRHYSLSAADRLEIDLRRREHNRLGFAVQLCVMRHPGRVLAAGEIPPRAMLKYVADQIGADPPVFPTYARREETRRDHIARLMSYLGVRSATSQDRRAGLLSAIEAAAMSDSGASIANAIVATLRELGVLLPAAEIIERMGFAARAIARRPAEGALVEGLAPEKLQALDKLLEGDAAIGQTRFHWLRSAPEAPAASHLVGPTERIAFLRTFGIDPGFRARVASGRWDQMVRKGKATPAWLANDFNASRRHALIVAQVIKLGEKLTDDAVTMFIKLIGRLFSQANSRKKRRHMDHRTDTSKALRMFLDTITALQSANDRGQDALEVLDQKVGWYRLLRMKPELAAMVEENEVSPLMLAAEQVKGVLKYAMAFLTTFTFRSARRHDSLLTAVAMLRRLHSEGRRALPERVPTSHLSPTDRKLILGQQKPEDRAELLSWLLFIASGLGPFSGQAVHFQHAAPEGLGYAVNRYRREAERHYQVLDDHLTGRDFIVGKSCTIADMSAWGWLDRASRVRKGEDDPLGPFPNLKRLFHTVDARPAAARARRVGEGHEFKKVNDEETKRALFPSNYPPSA
jgi:hypothetical protein